MVIDNKRMSDDQREIMKQAMKEALKEWMDERYAQFGRWSLYTCMAAAFTALGYFIFVVMGMHR